MSADRFQVLPTGQARYTDPDGDILFFDPPCKPGCGDTSGVPHLSIGTFVSGQLGIVNLALSDIEEFITRLRVVAGIKAPE